jgi:hypothetical protein
MAMLSRRFLVSNCTSLASCLWRSAGISQ